LEGWPAWWEWELSERVEQMGPGVLVDFSADGVPIGLELTAPSLVTAEEINRVLAAILFS